MDEAGAVEEDVDRPDLARERLDRLVRADVELALVGVEALEAGDVDVRRDDARALARKGLGRRRGRCPPPPPSTPPPYPPIVPPLGPLLPVRVSRGRLRAAPRF